MYHSIKSNNHSKCCKCIMLKVTTKTYTIKTYLSSTSYKYYCHKSSQSKLYF